MYITNNTEIWQNASKIIARVVAKKEPTLVLRRSKPVAYIFRRHPHTKKYKKNWRRLNPIYPHNSFNFYHMFIIPRNYISQF